MLQIRWQYLLIGLIGKTHRELTRAKLSTNRGVAKVSRAALRRVGNGVDDLECEGYLGDPSVKGSLRILRR